MRVGLANEAFYQLFGDTPEQLEGRVLWETGRGVWSEPSLRRLLLAAGEGRERLVGFEIQRIIPPHGTSSPRTAGRPPGADCRRSARRITCRRSLSALSNSHAPTIDAAGHTLTLSLPEEPVLLTGDPVRLTQVVSAAMRSRNACANEPMLSPLS